MGSGDLNNSSTAHFSPFQSTKLQQPAFAPRAVGLSLAGGLCQLPTAHPEPTHPAGMGQTEAFC